MSRRARQRAGGRRHYRPGPVALNTLEIASNGAKRLSDTDVHRQVAIVQAALAGLSCGQHCLQHWRSLADSANMAESLAAIGLGRGADADEVIQRAQQALQATHERQATRGTWTMYHDEIDALGWLVRLFAVQLAACSYREFEAAFRSTQRRISQALAGNAGAGAVVVGGDLGAKAISSMRWCGRTTASGRR